MMHMEPTTKPRVLIVDDERFNLTALATLLRDSYKVMVATSGMQALDAVRQHKPELVLLDVNMPEMDGYEVCRLLQADPETARIPIIFITALSDAVAEATGLDLGAADYITKPFNHAVVQARVRTQLRLKQQSDIIERYAYLDALTGLPNRRALDQKASAEWTRAQQTGLPLSVALLDVDHFKRFNDHYGHGAGDACLQAVGRALGRCVRRDADMGARYGGEEFAFILPETDTDAAASVAEAVRAAVAALAIAHADSSAAPFVTVSVGVATAIPGPAASVADLFAAADAHLYAAKAGGRNRVSTSR